jgi:hypothetical protein
MKKTIVLGILLLSAAFVSQAQTTRTDCSTANYGSTGSIDCTSTTAQPPAPGAATSVANSVHNGMPGLAGAIAQRHAANAQEKNDLTTVVYCRQNPSASISPNGKDIACERVLAYTVSYCTVHAKEKLCKEVAKLPPAAVVAQTPKAVPVTAPAPVVAANVPPAAQPVAPEVSVAEAARQARAAKAVQEAAAQDNPPAPQQ